MIERLRAHYGFNRTPFGRDLAPGMLHRHRTHAEAVARITWLVQERTLGVVTGSVGAAPRFHKANIILQATELLSAEEHERARTPILIVDEAHLLGCDQLEEVRM